MRSRSRRHLVWVFIAGMLAIHAFFFFQQRERIRRGYPDFTVFYTGGTILRQGLGRQLYEERTQHEIQRKFAEGIDTRQGPLPYIHPPFEALIFLPLTYLSYQQAFWVWDTLNLGMLFGIALLLRRHVAHLRAVPLWQWVLGLVAFFPIFVTLLQGQDAILFLLCCALGLDAMKRDSDFLAGGWFGLGVFRYQLMLPLVLLLILWKRRRVGAGFVAVAGVLAALSVALIGWKETLHYPLYVFEVVSSPEHGWVLPELMPNLRGLFEGWSLVRGRDLHGLVTVTVLAMSAGLFVFATRKGRALSGRCLDLSFSLAVVVVALIGYQVTSHDLSMLVLPIVLLADYAATTDGLVRNELGSGRQFALMIPVIPLLISPVWFLLWFVRGRLNLLAIPLLWWAWEIGRELVRGRSAPAEAVMRVP